MSTVYLAVDRDGTETINESCPERVDDVWWTVTFIVLPTGTIRRLIGRDLTWKDEPVELTSETLKF